MKKIHLLAIGAAISVLAGCSTYRESMGSAKRVEMNELPMAAQTTIQREIGNRQIARIDQDTMKGETAYRVEVQEKGLNPTLWVSPSGTILKESSRLSQRQINEAAGSEAPPMRTDPDYQ